MPADRLFHQKAGHSHKVSLLTDLEYRVWTQYLLSADDFGVMRATAVKLQADNDHLAHRPVKMILRCLEAIVKCGLVRAFDHQGAKFVYQHDWQDFQKVTWPAKTINPPIPDNLLADCSEATRLLFSVHPGAKKVPAKNSGSTSEVLSENSAITPEELSSTRAGAPAKRLTATGSGLTAGSLEGSLRETPPPMDVWWQTFVATYPEARRRNSLRINQVFVDTLLAASDGPRSAWARMIGNLSANVSSHEWRVKGMAPSMDKYLEEGRWENVLPATAPVAEQVSAKTSRTLSAASEILNGRAS